MKKFMLKSVLIVIVMFVCVLFGMQQANEGILRMKGFEDHQFQSALSVKEAKDGEIQASILGNEITSHDLSAKKEKLQKNNTYNFFSSIGKNLSEAITTAAQKLISLFDSKDP